MVGAVLIATAWLAVIALLAFAISFVAFLVQTSRHRSSGGWAAAAGASLILDLVFGGIADALQGEGGPSFSEGRASVPNVAEQADHDTPATVTRVGGRRHHRDIAPRRRALDRATMVPRKAPRSKRSPGEVASF